MADNRSIPNSTQVPNIILDFIIPRVSEGIGKCLLYICRRTYGFHKERDRISFNQFIYGIVGRNGVRCDHGAGLARSTVFISLKILIESGLVVMIRFKGGNTYEINHALFEVEDPIKAADEVVRKSNWFGYRTTSGSATELHPVRLPNLQKKGNKEKQSIARRSAHQRFIDFFYETVRQTRGFKPKFTAKDGKLVKDIILLDAVPYAQLEQMALYFLAKPEFKKFSPLPSVFLSAGILTGITNRLKNSADFWKEVDSYTQAYLKRPAEIADIREKIEQLARKLTFSSKSRTEGQEAGARDERQAKAGL